MSSDLAANQPAALPPTGFDLRGRLRFDLLAAGLLWGLAFAQLVTAVPRAIHVAQHYGLMVPQLTKVVFSTPDWALAILAAVAWVAGLFCRNSGLRFLLLIVLPVLVNVVMYVGTHMLYVKLVEGLMR